MCKRKKAKTALLAAVLLGLGVSACAGGPAAENTSEAQGQTGPGEEGGAAGGTRETPGSAGAAPGSEADAGAGTAGGLTYLCDPVLDSACSTAEGYYYLTSEIEELADGSYGSHLMYMDYASQQEIYLCSTAGCGHDTPDCPAVFLYDEFPIYSTRLFLYRDSLYILSRESDQDGSMSVNMIGEGDMGTVNPEAAPAVLYRANLDGTDRRAVYTFEENLTLEDVVMGDETGIYLITKEVSVEQQGEVSYSTSSKRKLVRLNPDEGTLEEVCSMEFDDAISWNVAGCSGSSLILYGVDYGKEVSREELWDDDSHKELFLNSDGVYAALDLRTGEKEELLRLPNCQFHSAQVLGGQLYFSSEDSTQVKSLNLDTKEERVLCELPNNQILDCLGEYLCCRDWDLSGDFTWYFVDTRTGEVSHSGLVNLRNGWDLDFRARPGEDVLVVYDYDAVDNGDGSYEINQYKYALISMEDLLAGRDNYRKIEMIGRGE